MDTTSKVYARLDAIFWFSRCGLALPVGLPFDCEPVPSWSEAAVLSGGEYWDWVTTEAGNMLTVYLDRFFRDEYQKWNGIVKHAKEVLTSGPWARVEAYAKEHQLEHFISSCVRWDTLNAVMEAAYERFNPPIFFLKLLEVYESGHFPCGWEGKFPKGRLLVL